MMNFAKTQWEISVISAMEKTITVIVPRNCTTAILYDELNEHPLATIAGKHVLISTEGELENSEEKHLADYDIQNKGTVQLIAKVDGAVWPSVDDLEACQQVSKAREGMEITTSEEHPDVFGFDDNAMLTIMACGHAVAPLSLALHCYDELEKGEESIRCPACDTRWKFSEICEAAWLSADECHEFERKALLNRMKKKQEEIKSCPKCSAFCTRSNDKDRRVICSHCTVHSGKQYEFCWICLREWKDNVNLRCERPECDDNKSLFHSLATCTLKELNGVKCPSNRACPRCLTLVEYVKDCKDRTCAGCKYEFCFICLKPYPCGRSAWVPCDLAPRQTAANSQSKPELWRLYMSYDDRFFLDVTANCFVDEFFRSLYYHPIAPKVCGYRVVFEGVRLDNRERKRLSEYGISNNSRLLLVINLSGG